jgi:beta-N-acetylhexosaminidase
MKKTYLMLVFILTLAFTSELRVIQKPIVFDRTRIDLTKAYIDYHYGMKVKDITIKPRIIVLHWTGSNSLSGAYNTFAPAKLRGRSYIKKAGQLNVSAHFLVDRDGTIYQLMQDNWMARHVIGLNYSAIGIENIGGGKDKDNLTPAQVEANVLLIRHLKRKYPDIDYLIGHYEYWNMRSTSLWLEKDKKYRTWKSDPGKAFMKKVRTGVDDLNLKTSPNTKKQRKISMKKLKTEIITLHPIHKNDESETWEEVGK